MPVTQSKSPAIGFQQNLPPAPASLITLAGATAPLGRYAGRIASLDTRPLDDAWAQRRLRRKTWQYIGVYTHTLLCGFAVADVGYVGTAFCYVYHVESGRFLEVKCTKPFAFPAQFQPGWQGVWQIRDGSKLWRFAQEENGRLQLTLESPKLNLHLVIREPHGGLSALAPGRPFHYTYKNAAIEAEGSIWAFDQEHRVSGPVAIWDYSRGYPPRETRWNWASLAGSTETSQNFGLNLVSHFNDGLENGLWLDGTLLGVGQARFTYGKPIDKVPWHIYTDCQVLDMTFHPLGARSENTNLLVAKTIFSQPFGRFEGHVRLPGSPPVAFTAHGVVEEHFALW